jgi:plastocyanin
MVVPVACGIALILAVASDANAETVRVSMKDRVFTPQLVKVKVGDRVEWVNDDTDLHNVISGATHYDPDLGHPMMSGVVMWNASYVFTFMKPGSYPYLCFIHSSMEDSSATVRGMVGEIIVTSE